MPHQESAIVCWELQPPPPLFEKEAWLEQINSNAQIQPAAPMNRPIQGFTFRVRKAAKSLFHAMYLVWAAVLNVRSDPSDPRL